MCVFYSKCAIKVKNTSNNKKNAVYYLSNGVAAFNNYFTK